jgi:hypothetical protein
MARTMKTPPTRLDTLPVEILEEIIAHLLRTESDKKWTDNDQSLRKGAPRQLSSPSTARKRTLKALTLLPKSTHIPLVRRKIFPTPVYDPQYASILNIRLSNRRLAAAAFSSFIEHISIHPWDLKAQSLSNLADLLMNEKIVTRVTCLRLSSFRIHYDTYISPDPHAKYGPGTIVVIKRNTTSYTKLGLKKQLEVIFRQASNLSKLVLTVEINRMRQNDARVCEQTARGVVASPEMYNDNPEVDPSQLPYLQAALTESGVSGRFGEMEIYTHCDMDFFNRKLEGRMPEALFCKGVRRLTIDPVQLMNQELRLECPELRTVEIVNLARLQRWRLSILHARLAESRGERERLGRMFGHVEHVVLSGVPIPNAICQGREVGTSTVYSLISYIARCTTRIERVSIRRAKIYEDGEGNGWRRDWAPRDSHGELLDDVQNIREFMIGVLELDEVRWVEYERQDMLDVKSMHSLSREKEVWDRLRPLERLVNKVEFGIPTL